MTPIEFLEKQIYDLNIELKAILKSNSIDPIEKGDKQVEINDKIISINKEISKLKAGDTVNQMQIRNIVLISFFAIITFNILKGKK